MAWRTKEDRIESGCAMHIVHIRVSIRTNGAGLNGRKCKQGLKTGGKSD